MILNSLLSNKNDQEVFDLLDTLNKNNKLSYDQYLYILDNISQVHLKTLFDSACALRDKYYNKQVYIRGLIEFSNVCYSDCYYCGIRKNADVERYRLSYKEMKEVVDEYYHKGYRSFVFQSGDNPNEDINNLANFLQEIKNEYNPIALTLSIGEKNTSDYELLKKSGLDRFLLRHETACSDHFAKLHPKNQTLENRLKCASDMKDLDIQVGLGLMVNSPFQDNKTLAKDLCLLNTFQPSMIGIGPYLKSEHGIFSEFDSGTALQTVVIVALARLSCPTALIPSTTALGLCDPNGRVMGLNAGCNVVMINLTPNQFRKDYSLYNKDVSAISEIEKNTKIIIQDIKDCGLDANFGLGHHVIRSESNGAK